MEIMTKEHPRWNEFIDRLAGKEGCDFEEDSWKCSRETDKPLASKILKSMGNIDVTGSLKYFEKNGGYCDCEILFNVVFA